MACDIRGDVLFFSVCKLLKPPVVIEPTEVVRQSTLTKRCLPGLSVSSHIKYVASCCGPVASSSLSAFAGPIQTDLELLQHLFPNLSPYACSQARNRSQTLLEAADGVHESGYHDTERGTVTRADRIDADVNEWYLRYLANAYPLKALDRIRFVLRGSSWNLRKSIDLLHTMPDTLTARRKCGHLPGDDTTGEAFLHFNACLELARQIGSARKDMELRARKITQAWKAGCVSDCLVCYQTCALPMLLACKADPTHHICEACFVQHISVQVFEEGVASTRCVVCPADYGERAFLELLPSRTRTVFTRLEARRVLASASSASNTSNDRSADDTMHACKCGNVVYVPIGITVHTCFVCLASTCILCDTPSHVPLRCDEVEKDAAAKLRCRIEEAMTAALVRKCVCGQVFLKESGCNKMTCKACGALMCYLCKSQIDGYCHFQGTATRCTLYGDYMEIDNGRILAAAATAATAAGVTAGE